MFKAIKQNIKQQMISSLQGRGYRVEKQPNVFLHHPDAEVKLSFEHILGRYLACKQPVDFFFIQIGAYDGVTNDPIHPFVRQYGWRGVLVEPQRQAFEKLMENYRDQLQLTFINAAVASQDGEKELYRVRQGAQEGLPGWSEQIASFDLQHLIKHKHGMPDYGITQSIPNVEDLIEVEKVPTLSLDSVLDRVGEETVHLLQIDTEGYDFELIKTINFSRVRPHIIHYEHMHLRPEDKEACMVYLVQQGYQIGVGFADSTAILASES